MVCSDKTGTLTENEMTARYIYTLVDDQTVTVRERRREQRLHCPVAAAGTTF